MVIMQTDCNLVLYDSAQNNKATWASNTWVSTPSPSCYAELMTTGALTVYRSGSAVFTTVPAPSPITDAASSVIYVMQDDGNFVSYQCSTPYWASNTWTAGAGFIQMDPSLNPDFVPPQFLVDGFKNKCFGDDPVACADAANDEIGFIEFPSVTEN